MALSVLETVIRIVSSINLRKEINIHPDIDLIASLDFESIQLIELISDIERLYGVDISGHEDGIAGMDTPRKIAEYVALNVERRSR